MACECTWSPASQADTAIWNPPSLRGAAEAIQGPATAHSPNSSRSSRRRRGYGKPDYTTFIATRRRTNLWIDDRGREGLCTSPPSEPYGRFSRIRLSSRWFPHRDCLAFHQAASRVNSSGGAKNLFGRQTIPNASFDTVTGADSMRSVQTEPFTRDKSRASAP